MVLPALATRLQGMNSSEERQSGVLTGDLHEYQRRGLREDFGEASGGYSARFYGCHTS